MIFNMNYYFVYRLLLQLQHTSLCYYNMFTKIKKIVIIQANQDISKLLILLCFRIFFFFFYYRFLLMSHYSLLFSYTYYFKSCETLYY